MSVQADQHFAIVPEWVLYADISSNAVRLYGTLRRYADKNGKAHPSRSTLAGHIRVKSVRTVDAALDELEKLGAVQTKQRTEGKRNLTSVYTVISAPPSAADCTTPSATDSTTPVQQIAQEPEPLNEKNPMRSPRKRDFVFDALAEVCGVDVDKATKRERGGIAKAAAEIREASEFAGFAYASVLAAVQARARMYRNRYPNAALTPNALAMHWGECAMPVLVATGQEWVPPAPLTPEELAESEAARKAAWAGWRA